MGYRRYSHSKARHKTQNTTNARLLLKRKGRKKKETRYDKAARTRAGDQNYIFVKRRAAPCAGGLESTSRLTLITEAPRDQYQGSWWARRLISSASKPTEEVPLGPRPLLSTGHPVTRRLFFNHRSPYYWAHRFHRYHWLQLPSAQLKVFPLANATAES